MKKSIAEAMQRAKAHSLEHLGITVRVLDRPRKHAVVCASEWIYKERVLEGWRTVAVFKDGKEV